MDKKIYQVLMARDGMSESDAKEAVAICQTEFNERVANGEMCMDICEEHFGLEPDFLDELMY